MLEATVATLDQPQQANLRTKDRMTTATACSTVIAHEYPKRVVSTWSFDPTLKHLVMSASTQEHQHAPCPTQPPNNSNRVLRALQESDVSTAKRYYEWWVYTSSRLTRLTLHYWPDNPQFVPTAFRRAPHESIGASLRRPFLCRFCCRLFVFCNDIKYSWRPSDTIITLLIMALVT